jgi:hypothetical protein
MITRRTDPTSRLQISCSVPICRDTKTRRTGTHHIRARKYVRTYVRRLDLLRSIRAKSGTSQRRRMPSLPHDSSKSTQVGPTSTQVSPTFAHVGPKSAPSQAKSATSQGESATSQAKSAPRQPKSVPSQPQPDPSQCNSALYMHIMVCI